VGSGHLLKQVRQFNLNPNNVAIEIIESRVNDTGALNEFISRHREYGFLFALDDIGSGYSNLDRITITEPDLLKIDRSLISQIDINYHKQEVLKSLVNLARRIGALVVAEGVEREEDTTDPYISLASGNLCITISALVKPPENACGYILCIDVNQDL